jgi:xanthine dehydrogenase YagR molybdenum-binding subunit
MPWPKNPRHLGKENPRVDGPVKVAGRAKYTSDVAPSGVLYGAIVRATVASGRLKALDLAKARSAPGIRAAIPLHEPGFQILFHGQELAALAGTTKQAVRDALDLVKAEIEATPFVVNETEAAKSDAARAVPDRPNFSPPQLEQNGDVDAALASAAAVVEGTLSTPVLIHNPLEPHGATVQAEGDELTLWTSTQFLFEARDSLARGLGVPQNKVRGICDYMGGGFGGKIEPWDLGTIAARLAQAAGAPVKLILTRAEEAQSVGNRPSTFQKIRLAADREGKLTAFSLDVFGTPGHVATTEDPGGTVVDFPAPYIYPVPNTRIRRSKLATNTGLATWMRAPGHPPASFGIESMLDDLAVKLGIDPVEMRIKNDPFPIRQQEYKLGAERFRWKEKYRKPGSSPGPVKVGIGCAGATWPGAGDRAQADLQVNSDGTVEVRVGTQDLGTGSRTVAQLVAAEMLNLDPARITVRIGDTRFPPSGVSGGSMTTGAIAPPIYDACERAIAQLKEVSGLADPTGANWDAACAKLDRQSIVVHGAWKEGLTNAWTGGVQFAEVEVDTDTGFVRVRRMLGVHDCGLVVNRLTCRNQIYGGIIMGLGYALYEQRVMDDRTGVVLNPGFELYKLPGATDIPEIDVLLLDMPERGIIGIGEPATIPTAAAIANAVANALGVRVPSLPITPDRVLAALGRMPLSDAEKAEREAIEAGFQYLAAKATPAPKTSAVTGRRHKAYA